jgi:hypothetical protein
VNVSLRSACFTDETSFQVESKTSVLGVTLLKCWVIRISGLSYDRLKEFCWIYMEIAVAVTSKVLQYNRALEIFHIQIVL